MRSGGRFRPVLDFLAVKDLRQLLRSFRLAIRTVHGAGRSLTVVTVAAAVLQGLVPVAMSIAMANMVGSVVGAQRDGPASPAGARLTAAAVAYVALLAVQGAVAAAVVASAQWVRRQLDGRLRERVINVLLRPSGLQHLEDPAMRPLVDAARGAAPASGMSPGTVASVLPAALGARLDVLARVAGLMYLSWPLGVAVLLFTVKAQDEMQKAIWRVAGAGGGRPPDRVAYPLELGTTPAPGKEVRIFSLGRWITGRYQSGMRDHSVSVWSNRRDFTPGLIITLAAIAALDVLAVVVLGRRALSGDVGVGEMAFALSALIALSPGFNQDDMPLAFAATTIGMIESAERLVESDTLALGGTAGAVGLPRRTIRFEGVSFKYPSAVEPVFTDLNFELRAGQRTALVGLNGAGKTTLVKLLCGMYEPTAGRIVVDDDTDLRDVDVAAWRRQLAVLFQDYSRYELTVRDNVRYGAPHWQPDDLQGELEAVASAAGISGLIARLPKGWDSPLSPGLRDGTELSGGQWQRVALARALFSVRAGAQVLVLDEPTASLDVRAEAELFQTILAVTDPAQRPRGAAALTTLMISHRFSTVRQADRIVVVQDGRIVEDGSHRRLVRRGRTYATLFAAQAQRYTGGPLT